MDNRLVGCIGIGSCGCRNVDMIEKVYDVDEFILMDTDLKSLQKNISEAKQYMPFIRNISSYLIGEKSFKGLGVDNVEQGKHAAIESQELIRQSLEGADVVFIVVGFGSGTGTGAAPVVANYAKELGKKIIGVVTMPFNFEGEKRRQVADEGLKELKKYTDDIVVFENEDIFMRELSAKASEVIKLRYADCSKKVRESLKKNFYSLII